MDLAKDVGKLIGGMVLVIGAFVAFAFIIYVIKYGICIPALK
jgi:hypothetical protein